MSNRVMSVLKQVSPHVEVYSIDESFVSLDGLQNYTQLGQDMRQRVLQWTGLPVCVGIGSTKTLAKLANHVAKKHPQWNSVCNLTDLSLKDRLAIIGGIEVSEVWGIGRRISARLAELNIFTVSQLCCANLKMIRREFSVVMERTVSELQGISCIALEEAPPAKQQIMCSRSFGQPVDDLPRLEEAVASYTSRSAEKLRRQQHIAGGIYVLLETNPFKPDTPQYHPTLLVPLVTPTADTRLLVAAAQAGLKQIYREGYLYKKAGVMLTELGPAASQRQADLFAVPANNQKSEKLMGVLDALNTKFGRGTINIAAVGVNQDWQMRQDRRSPSYTTSWKDLLRVSG